MIKKLIHRTVALFITVSWVVTLDTIQEKSPIIDSATTHKIGKQIWQNETGGRPDLLVFWHEKEPFPSFGIGHYIWAPEGSKINYTQGFPPLCEYLKQHGIALPSWLKESLPKGAPWKNREDFYNDNTRIQELRKLLVENIELQTQFMIERLKNVLPEIINSAPMKELKKIKQRIDLMLSSPLGTYALIDYLNFKGDGLNPKEECNGERWGLLSVLLAMPDNLTVDNATKAFTIAAAERLLMRIKHSAPDYQYIYALDGWMSRLSTYNRPNILK